MEIGHIMEDKIDHGREFDWGRASADYAKYRDIYPEAFYRKIVDMGLCTKGQRVLDLGTGTGVLPRNLYKYGAKFTGADIAKNQIEQAMVLSEGMEIEYAVGAAEELKFSDASFDVVTACQCFWYFDEEIVLPRIHALLKEDGRLLIIFMVWLPEEGPVGKMSEQLVLKYNPDWTGAGWRRFEIGMPAFADGFFKKIRSVSYDVELPFTRESWNGRIKACRGIGASSLSEEEIAAFEREHLRELGKFPQEFTVLHYVTMLELKKT
ncbi:class I SAM-dependent methyltransferase [Christensenellaceae bacterium OttesenSCG-928-K19]|nr:class I SAM-dependent methyltransferase [Christensenellaceae bacterium OttesenSCG-928-K19]